ncbi:unnamed protein product [Rotaria magnacalcarata]|uniref:Uncharacterized protein n=1 Tax=Rotaria magnacalcarata TaxID=392030 RepID=A0A814G1S2_9BILA|nr:unnamed protein product [Rotaria magnacalcarata]
MVDTGATHSLIARSTLNYFSHPPIQKTSTTTAVLGDASTTINVHGFIRLCIYINHIPTFASVFVVDSLGVDFILGMDWCINNDILLRVREQQVIVRNPSYGTTAVHFLDSVSIPIRLAQSIQLAPHHEHIVRSFTPLSFASCVSYIPNGFLCRISATYHIEEVSFIYRGSTTVQSFLMAESNSTNEENVEDENEYKKLMNNHRQAKRRQRLAERFCSNDVTDLTALNTDVENFRGSDDEDYFYNDTVDHADDSYFESQFLVK